jgi:outer membrane protein TolC
MRFLRKSILIGFVLAFAVNPLKADTLKLSLREAIAYAIENSYQSQLAAKDVQKSKQKVKETISMGLPQVNAEASYINNLEIPASAVPAEFFGGEPGELATVRFGAEQQMSANITANQLIFDGSYFVGLQASRVYLELARNDQEKSEADLRKLVMQAYGNVLVTEKNEAILSENVRVLRKNLKETTALYENGFLEEQDKDQIALLLANAENAHARAIRQIAIAKNQLKFTLGIEVENNLVLSENLEQITTQVNNQDYLSEEFNFSNHIDYKLISTQEQATGLLMKQEKSTYLPKLSAFYTYQQNSFANEFNFFNTDGQWLSGQFVGLNLSLPLFSSFGRYQRVQQAKVEFERLGIAKKQVEQQLLIQAENAKSEYTYALQNYQTTESNMKLAERIYEKIKIKYQEGISSSLELTQANNQLLESQGNFINASLQLINAKANLDQALNTY